MAITLVLGTLGEGKTYFALWKAFSRWRKGADVFANFYVHKPLLYQYGMELERRKRASMFDSYEEAERFYGWGHWSHFTEYDQLLKIRANERPAVVLIDEAGAWFPQAYAEILPPQLAVYWAQSRKIGVDSIMCVQQFRTLWQVVGGLAGYWVKAKRLHVPGVWFKYTWFDSSTWLLRKKDLVQDRVVLHLDYRLAECYDTKEIILPPYMRAAQKKFDEEAARRRGPQRGARTAAGAGVPVRRVGFDAVTVGDGQLPEGFFSLDPMEGQSWDDTHEGDQIPGSG